MTREEAINKWVIPAINKVWNDKRCQEILEALEQEPIMALLEKTYADFCKCEGGEGWLKIDGKEYFTDVGYAIDGMRIFMEVFKRRLAESEK